MIERFPGGNFLRLVIIVIIVLIVISIVRVRSCRKDRDKQFDEILQLK